MGIRLGTSLAALACWIAVPLMAQTAISGEATSGTAAASPAVASASAQNLFNFKDSDVKFDIQELMHTLRDKRHEGWVLHAYPDPQTRRPLIGAGFSLDLPARAHLQRDPQNPNSFLEPSSAQLWQAAGLSPERLQEILAQFDREKSTWITKRRSRHKVHMPAREPQITEAEAMQLLRISVIHAASNARAYCRNFDRLSAEQQMAFSQLVYQMGVNLEQFSQFLGVMNSGIGNSGRAESVTPEEMEQWRAVQRSLMTSQWARRYSGRAATVIAMFDPEYSQSPNASVQKVSAVLSPPVVRHRKVRGGGARLLRVSSHSARSGKSVHAKVRNNHGKRKLA